MDNLEYIKELLSKKVEDLTKIVPEASIRELGIDSLDLVDMMLEAESKLDVTFSDEELLAIQTVGDVMALLDKGNHK